MTEEKYRFDLSDGLGKEDFFAIFASIWKAIMFVLKVIFYPYVWIMRMFGRTYRFARTKRSPEKALNEDERFFVESVPGFFVLVGFFGGVLFGILIYLTKELQFGFTSFLEELNLDYIVRGIAWWLEVFLEVILWIIGIDDRTQDPVLDRWGILDIIFDHIVPWTYDLINSVTQNAILTFGVIAVLGVILAIIWIVISETGIIGAFFGFFTKIFSTAVGVPSSIWNRSNRIYRKYNSVLASIVIGQHRLDERNIGFHRKVILITLALGIYTLVFGVFIGLTNPQEDTWLFIFYVFTVILALGIGVGIVGMLVIVRFLDFISRGKHTPKTA